MQQERPYWNMEMEPLLNTPQMAEIQMERLKKQLIKAKARAPFFARMMERNKLDPDRLSGFDEFKEKIDIFTKATWNQLVAECDGDMLKALDQRIACSLDEVSIIATTTGTTGVPSPYAFTRKDLDEFWAEYNARGHWRSGIRAHDRVLHCLALSMVIAGVPGALGFSKSGATVLPVGAEAKTERILRTQGMWKGTVYFGTPSLLEYLIEQAPKVVGKEVKDLGFKILLCAAEPGAGIPEVKAKIEKAYGARMFDTGAGLGFSCECQEYQGMHWVGDDVSYYELVDPDTKQPIPLEDGAKGEMLMTNLNTDALFQMRESAGDIHQVFTEPCKCGKTGFRYKIVGRADDMLKVKGIMVYPTHIKGVINDFVPKVTGELRIILDEPPPRVVPPLKIRVEHAEGLTGVALDALAHEISETMSRRLKINPQIIWAEPGSLERSLYKGKMFEKVYESKGTVKTTP
ncbi:MAG: Phenylacetate-coenzyme A ligase [Syntrophorhabdus sp. PtaU1.Bin153]|nr:MAG: Phenylacetate-coenzyme A ligase [Syntrophorhabdus sp. PtaU1.Bin153]